MKTKYISDLDFSSENPFPIIFVCDKSEEITKVYIKNLNDEYFGYVKKYLKKLILKEILSIVY